MLRFYAVIFRWIIVYAVPIISFILLLVFRKKRKVQIIVLLSAVTIFFFMFFFGVYVRVPNINEAAAEKIWDTLSALEFGEPRPDIESSEIKSYSEYEEERDSCIISVEKWISDEEMDLDYCYSIGPFPPNGMDLIYDLLMTGGKENEYAWKISPLSASRAQEELYAFGGWYKGSFVIKKGNQYIRTEYYVKTSFGNLSGFMCIPPIGFDLEEFIMQFA
ncbi:MAG TPA: hypothetical protein GXZ23_05860 [Clostridiales bacterium]|nr:hypothetical protein [Clostridiales bacterium]